MFGLVNKKLRSIGSEEEQSPTSLAADKIVPLSPISDPEEMDETGKEDFKTYNSYFSEALSNPRINNIAVTGNYGIGKSSMLYAFENQTKNQKKKWIHISLGSFKLQDDGIETVSDRAERASLPEDNLDAQTRSFSSAKSGLDIPESVGSSKKEADRKKLEANLLRQLLSTCKHAAIPQSSFRLIPENKRFVVKSIYIVTIAIALLSIFTLLMLPTSRSAFQLSDSAANTISAISLVALSVVILIVSWYVGYTVLPHIRFSQLRFEAFYGEVEVSSKKIPFDLANYCFELVYVLESLAKKYASCIVVVEDIDRLDSESAYSLLTLLREINTIVNQRLRATGRAKKVVFIHVLNDNITALMDKEKYFDYILPIVPSLSAENAKYKLRTMITNRLKLKGEDWGTRENKLIEIIAPYLADYRIVNCILNEYIVFSTVDGSRNNNPESSGISFRSDLFAFVVYKILFPADYYSIRLGTSTAFPLHGNQQSSKKSTLVNELQENQFLTMKCLRYVGYSSNEIQEFYNIVFEDCGDILRSQYLQNTTDEEHIQYCLNVLNNQNCAEYVTRIEVDWIYFLMVYSTHSGQHDSCIQAFDKLLSTFNNMAVSPDKSIDGKKFSDSWSIISEDIKLRVVKSLILINCDSYAWLFSNQQQNDIWQTFSVLSTLIESSSTELDYLSKMFYVSQKDATKWFRDNAIILVTNKVWTTSMIDLSLMLSPRNLPAGTGTVELTIDGRTKTFRTWRNERSDKKAADTKEYSTVTA